jgi:hypothetical protein
MHEKFRDREMWIRVREIMTVYRMDGDDYTTIMFQNGVHFYVTESVEEILEAINSEV